MTKQPLHILKFRPILKEKIWGGNKLNALLGKKNTIGSETIGESWEVSDVEGNYSVICNGTLEGKTLHELLVDYKEQLVGIKNYKRFGTKFPLLIKFIDAKKDLSVQLHPGDELAKEKHNSLGKTEMWYIMQADPESDIIIGFNQKMNLDVYQKNVIEKKIKNILHYEAVSGGETFFIYAGLIHAIGKGVLLAEIQQTSDITYRVYDWDRQDANGNFRELHQEDALQAVDFEEKTAFRVPYTIKKNEKTDLVTCAHFITNLLYVDNDMIISHKELDSFVVYMCVEGKAVIRHKKEVVSIKLGETILVPAAISKIKIESKNVKLLQTYI